MAISTPLITVAEAKKHLNIDASFTDDDTYIASLISVAEQMILQHLDYKEYREILAYLDVESVPAPIIHACKLLVGNMYMNRESVSNSVMTTIPQSYEYLLATYKNRIGYSA